MVDRLTIVYLFSALPPPLEVQGLCSVVVWYSPDVPCERIHGYNVRLYDPQAVYQNVIRRVGSNGTFYIITDEDRLIGQSGKTYVQVIPYSPFCTGLANSTLICTNMYRYKLFMLVQLVTGVREFP